MATYTWLRRLGLLIHQAHAGADVFVLVIPVFNELLRVPVETQSHIKDN